MTKTFPELLASGQRIFLDGSMGTELERRGVAGRCAANLSSPEAVLDVHASYIRAGSNAVSRRQSCRRVESTASSSRP